MQLLVTTAIPLTERDYSFKLLSLWGGETLKYLKVLSGVRSFIFIRLMIIHAAPTIALAGSIRSGNTSFLRFAMVEDATSWPVKKFIYHGLSLIIEMAGGRPMAPSFHGTAKYAKLHT